MERKVKERIQKVVEEEIRQNIKKMKKLRFLQKFEKQEYIRSCKMEEVKKIMKVRLNMVELKANFRGKYEDTTCPACNEEEETTEHDIRCREYRRMVRHTMETDDCMKNINDTTWLIEAGRVYEQIEETRKCLTQ